MIHHKFSEEVTIFHTIASSAGTSYQVGVKNIITFFTINTPFATSAPTFK